MSLLLVCCGDEREGPIVLAPGDTLLDALGAARLAEDSAGNLPVAVAAHRFDRAEPVHVAAADWTEGTRPDEAKRALFAEALGRRGELMHWLARPAHRLDQPGGRLRFMHAGRELQPVGRLSSQIAARRSLIWGDVQGGAVFWWDASSGTLQAFSAVRPGAVAAEFRQDAAAEVGRYERDPDELGAPRQPADLERHVLFGRTMLRGLLLPAPATLDVPLAGLAGDTLHLALGVIDHAFAVDGDQVRPAPGLGDGVTFAVDVLEAGRVQRIWSRHLMPGPDIVRAEADLSAFAGHDVTLRLVSDPGPQGDRAFDYAVWGDLRLTGPAPGHPARPHIVLIDVDTLRADRLGCYGNPRDTSPRIDDWAARRATLYRRVTAPSSWTLPSTASILTGLDPQQHGATNLQSRLPSTVESIASRLSRAGYATRAITDGGGVVPAFGFDRGFDCFEVRERGGTDYDPGWGEALAWLDGQHSDRPVFLFLQTYLVHAPYRDSGRFPEPHPEATRWLSEQPIGRDLILPIEKGDLALDGAERAAVSRIYDEGVARMDAVVGPFLDALDEALGHDAALIILTSDHGEELFDHGGIEHGHSLHEELLHVPLLVSFPDGREPGATDDAVSSLDLVPTMLDVAGLQGDDRLPGRSLLAAPDNLRPFVGHTQQTLDAPVLQSLSIGWTKLLTNARDAANGEQPAVRLYDLLSDPHERTDLAGQQPVVVQDMIAVLRDYLDAHPPLGSSAGEADLPDDVLEDLRALGYVGEDQPAARGR